MCAVAMTMVTACGIPDTTAPTAVPTTPPASPTDASGTGVSAPPSPPVSTSGADQQGGAPPVSAEVAGAGMEPYIVSCQVGLGPITTYWSDGTVAGYSDYCQAQHDRVLEAEVEANSRVCDGTVCRSPSGAVMPDPSAVPSPAPAPSLYPTEDESYIRTCIGKTGQTREQCIAQIQQGIDDGFVRVP